MSDVDADIIRLKKRVDALEQGGAPAPAGASFKIEDAEGLEKVIGELAEKVAALPSADDLVKEVGDIVTMIDAVATAAEKIGKQTDELLAWKEGITPLLDAVNAEWEKRKTAEVAQAAAPQPQPAQVEEQPAQS